MRIGSLALLFSTLIGANQVLADPEHCNKLFATTPDAIQNWSVSKKAFEAEHPGVGYSVVYRSGPTTFSVFFYDAELDPITSEDLEVQLGSAVRDIRSVLDLQGATMEDVEAHRVDKEGSVIELLASGVDSNGALQLLTMGRFGPCMVKLRFTAPEDTAESRGDFGNLARQILMRLPWPPGDG